MAGNLKIRASFFWLAKTANLLYTQMQNPLNGLSFAQPASCVSDSSNDRIISSVDQGSGMVWGVGEK